jgi:hypothetical protein
MGIFDFFKKANQTARESGLRNEEPVIHKTINNPTKRRLISDEKFNNQQFQREMLAFALWKYNENSCDYLAAHKSLIKMEDIELTEKQADKIIEKLKLLNNLKIKKD